MDAFIRTHSSRGRRRKLEFSALTFCSLFFTTTTTTIMAAFPVPPAPTSPPTSQNVLLLESTHGTLSNALKFAIVDCTPVEHGAENGVGSDDVVAAAGNQSETLNNGDALGMNLVKRFACPVYIHIAGAPAWTITTRDNFNESINAVRDDLAESINTVNDRIDNVRDDLIQRLDELSHRMLTIQVIAARVRHLQFFSPSPHLYFL